MQIFISPNTHSIIIFVIRGEKSLSFLYAPIHQQLHINRVTVYKMLLMKISF